MSKRIHELAKDWGVAPKDILARAEKLGLRGKRSQSSLTDEEAERLKDDLGLSPRPAVSLGTGRLGCRPARHGARADDRDPPPCQRDPPPHRT